MRPATILEAPQRFARRELLLGGFTLAMAVVGLASLAAVALAGSGADIRLPGTGASSRTADARPSLVAVGYGEASAPAEIATLQLLIGPSSFNDTMIISRSSPAGEPGASEPGAAEREAVEPIVQALRGAGVAADDLDVVVSPAIGGGYYGPPGAEYGVRLDVTLRQPTLEGMNELVNAAGAAAMENGLGLAQVGAGYTVADCAALVRQARERAIADCRATARQQADLLGTPLGALLLASDVPPTTDGNAASPADRCADPTAAPSPSSPWEISRLTVPAFNPTSPAEATVRVQVSLTFALAEA